MIFPCCGGNLFFYGVLLIFGGIYTLFKRHQLNSIKKENARKTARKRQEREEKLQELQEKFQLTDEYKKILGLPFDDLLSSLQERELSAVNVLSAFMAKSIECTTAYNSITEFNPVAMDIAKALDSSANIKGPLHGLPVCIKDDMNIKGMDTTMGYSSLLYKPAEESSAIVKAFIELGAIPFCKTNLPQTIFSYAGENPVFGRTLNPLNIDCGPGGSSSGTGSLVGSGGAWVGIGSDLGGSIRIPCHFNGIAGIRPTINRLSGLGVLQCLPKSFGVVGVPGPMAKSSHVVARTFKALTENKLMNKHDPLTAMPISWNQEIFESKKPLKIGYYTSIDYFPPLGDTEGVVLAAKRHLESLGHTLVSFEIKDSYEILKVYFDILGGDQGEYLHDMLKVEPEVPDIISGLKAGADMPIWKRLLFDFISTHMTFTGFSWWGGSERLKPFVRGGLDVLRSKNLWETMAKRTEMQREMLRRMEELGIDLILSPAFPFPAIKHEDAQTLLPGIIYTCIYNFYDFPSGVIPFGKESGANIEKYDTQGEEIFKVAKESIKASKGMPINVQITGRPFCEELVLRGMVEVEKGKMKT